MSRLQRLVPGLLGRHPEFRTLWMGATISGLGSQVTLLALPLTAILVLDASPLHVGLLTAASYTPSLLIGLLAGAWTDRLRRRPILISCDVLSALALGWIPLGAWLGLLRIEQLFVVAFLAGGLKVFADVASQAYLPSLVGSEALLEANSSLASSSAAVRIAGPSLAGVLVQLLSAPTAIALDAVSFVASAACVLGIRSPEPNPRPVLRRSLWAEIHEGLYLVLRSRLLRPIAVATAIYNFFAAIFVAVYTLFMVRDLALAPAAVGVVVASGGIGGVLGGLLASAAGGRLGLGRAIVGGSIALAVAHLAAPLAWGPPLLVVPLLASAGALANLGLVVSSVNQLTFIQHLTPPHALGRVTATQRVLITATVPVGALLGGLLGDAVGLRATVGIAALGTIGGMLTLLLSPLPALRSLDQTVREPDSLPTREDSVLRAAVGQSPAGPSAARAQPLGVAPR